MICQGLTPEDYRLYALGLCEPHEAEVIRTHLADGCDKCNAELRRSVLFWYRFALLGAEESRAEPRPELRSKVLRSIVGTRDVRHRTMSWPVAAAAAAVLGVASVVSWYLGHQNFLGKSQPAPVAVTQPAAPAEPQEDVAALRERLDRAERALAVRPKTAPAEPAPNATALDSALAEAHNALGQARQALLQEQTRTAELEAELQTQRALVGAAVRERQDAESRGKILAENQSKADERDQQIRTLTSRVQQLERENAGYKNVLDRQRRDIDQNLRLATLLSSPALRMVRLRPAENAIGAVGYAFVDGRRVMFYASKLPNLPGGRTYQLWLIRGRAPAIVSGGLFAAPGQQHAIVEFTDSQFVSDITAIAVTDEPAGGSSLPTGHKFLIGSLRS